MHISGAPALECILHGFREIRPPVRSKLLHLLDDVAAHGGPSVTAAMVRERLGLSPQAASNALARAVRDGFLDKVSSGTYALRPIGMLGTRAASEDVALAVAARFAALPHRIAYRSALDHHGLLVHPARTIQVALPRRVKTTRLSGRRLQVVVEPEAAISVGSEPAGQGAYVSTIERALLESAHRPRLVGGWHTIAEALQADTWSPARLQRLARQLEMPVALRRIASLAEHVGAVSPSKFMPPPAGARVVPLDPTDEPTDESWLDPVWRVRWPTTPEDARERLET
jgi:predicted transcriptional regulator of viral defense system